MLNTTISIQKGTSISLYFLTLFFVFGLFFANFSLAESMAEAELSISAANANEDTEEIAFTVSRTTATDLVTVKVASTDGSATAGNDYVAFSDTITFTAGGDLSQVITVTLNHDTDVEPDETFTMALSAPENATLSQTNSEAVGTIQNDDNANVTIEVGSAAENSGSIPFTVKLSAPASDPVTATVRSSDGLAKAGIDYTAIVDQEIEIPAGQLSASGSIVVNNDNRVERDETLSVEIDSIATAGLNVTIGSQDSDTGSILNDDTATVTISPSADTPEGNLGTSTMTFDVKLDNPVDGGFDISYQTNEGSATISDEDFEQKSSTLSYNGTANETKTISVNINGDSKIEPDETLSVSLGTFSDTTLGSNLSKAGTPATGTIKNDDTIKLSIKTGTVEESVGRLPFTITLDTLEAEPVPIAISTNNGSASTDDGDYVRLSQVDLVIPANQKSLTSFVTVNDDNKVEYDETLSVSIISFVSNGDEVSDTVPPASTGKILNDDSAQVVIVEPVSILEGDSGSQTLIVTAQLDKTVPDGFDIDYKVDEATATAGDDFVTTSGTLSFSGLANETQTFSVQIIGDEDVEPNEEFELLLENVSNSEFADFITSPITPIIGTIIDNDTAGITISDNTITEGESGEQMLTFEVLLTRKAVGGFTVDFTTESDTATVADNDFESNSGTLTFVGDTSEIQTISVQINSDSKVEGAEAFKVVLSNISEPNVLILDGEGIGVIENDDSASLSIQSPISLAEGGRGAQPITFTVSLDNPVQGGLELAWGITEDGATVTDTDYAATIAPLVFTGTAGESQLITIDVQGDTKVELDETLEIMLGTITLGSAISDIDVSLISATSSLTIENDDQAEIAFQGVSLPEGTSETSTQFTINAVLNAATDVPVTAVYSTTSGTGIDGVDFIGVTGTLTFTGASNEVQSITVEVPADADAEDPSKSFTIGISSIEADGRSVAAGVDATVIILDDDSGTEPPASRFKVFLPITARDYEPVFAPDLIVSNVIIFSDSIEVTIKNIGNAPVTKPFWVDSYINPTIPPTKVNQTIIDLGSQGFIWGIDGTKAGLPMNPGSEIILTVDGEYYRPEDSNFSLDAIPAGSDIYVQVDSYGLNPTYGAIEERHEIESATYNNIFYATAP